MTNIKRYLSYRITLFVGLLFIVLFVLTNLIVISLNIRFINAAHMQQNDAFIEMVEHLLDEGDQATTLMFVEHYGHTHSVYLSYQSADGNYFYETTVHPSLTAREYTVTVDNEVVAIVSIDNIDSNLSSINSLYLLTINGLLLAAFVVTLLILAKRLNTHNAILTNDIHHLEASIHALSTHNQYYFSEFKAIDDVFNQTLETLAQTRMKYTKNIQSLAHDIKTPLTILKATLEGIDKGLYPTDSGTYVQLLEETTAINKTVEALIEGDAPLKVENLKLPDAFKEVTEAFAPLFKQKGITLTLDYQTALTINAPKHALTRLCEHAMQNSLKAMTKGNFTLTLTHDAIILSDDGPGIPVKILEQFNQNKPIKSSSTGLGLTIMKEMAQSYFYGFNLESNSAGTTIKVYLHS